MLALNQNYALEVRGVSVLSMCLKFAVSLKSVIIFFLNIFSCVTQLPASSGLE